MSNNERELPVILTQEERDEAAHKCSEAKLEHAELETEFDAVRKGYQKRLKDKKADQLRYAQEARSGITKAMVPCAEITDWPAPTRVVRMDGRDRDGTKLPAGSPPAIIEEKAPEVQEVAGATPAADAPPDKQQGLFDPKPAEEAPASEGEPAEGDAAEVSEGDGEEADEDETGDDTEDAAEASDDAEHAEASADETPEPEAGDEPPPAHEVTTTRAKRPRKLRLVAGAH